MSSPPTATIYPFPRRPAVAAGEQAAEARLRRALAGLEAALDAQRQAVANWRGALGALGETVGGLHRTLTGQEARLATLGHRVEGLHAEALKLEAWADGALRRGESVIGAGAIVRSRESHDKTINQTLSGASIRA